MGKNEIKAKVNNAISKLIDEFKDNPYLFYTEGDIVCRLYALIQKELDYKQVKDAKEKRSQYIVHLEYPTPFRVNMKDKGFKIISPDKKGKKRGHYDIVVLNPKFVKKSRYDIVNGQDIKAIRDYLEHAPEPAILFGIEVIFNRDKKRGETTIKNFVADIRQDYNKLKDSIIWRKKDSGLNKDIKFIETIKMLAFDNASEKDAINTINEKLEKVCKNAGLQFIHPIQNRAM